MCRKSIRVRTGNSRGATVVLWRVILCIHLVVNKGLFVFKEPINLLLNSRSVESVLSVVESPLAKRVELFFVGGFGSLFGSFGVSFGIKSLDCLQDLLCFLLLPS